MRSSGGVQRPTEVKRSSGLYKEKDPGLMQVPSNWAHQDFGHIFDILDDFGTCSKQILTVILYSSLMFIQ